MGYIGGKYFTKLSKKNHNFSMKENGNGSNWSNMIVTKSCESKNNHAQIHQHIQPFEPLTKIYCVL